jgi:hypothetical protein
MQITFEDLALLLKEAFDNKRLILADHEAVSELYVSDGLGGISISFDHTEYETNLYKSLVTEILLMEDSIEVYYRPHKSYLTDIVIKVYGPAITKEEYVTTLNYLKDQKCK